MSVTSSLNLNQDLSAKSLRLRADNSGEPDMAKQQAWLKAMEQSQMQEWLRQGLTARGGHDTPATQGTSNVRELKTHYQDDAAKAGGRETVSDTQADPRSNGNAKQTASIEVADERNFVAQDARASAALPPASSVQRGSNDSTTTEVENENSQVKQPASALGMTTFAVHNSASLPGATQSFVATGNAIPLAGKFVQAEHAVQAIKMALQEITGIEARIVAPESLSQMTEMGRQTSQPISKLATGLSSKIADMTVLEESEIKEESANAGVTDKAEPLPEEHQAIRFHAEWSEDGLRLWLGINSNANMAKAQIVRQLHEWVAKQNVQLLALIWNGEQMPRNVLVQVLKEGAKPPVSSSTNSKPGDIANTQGIEDMHYFLNSYLQTKSQAKEMQWPSVQ